MSGLRLRRSLVVLRRRGNLGVLGSRGNVTTLVVLIVVLRRGRDMGVLRRRHVAALVVRQSNITGSARRRRSLEVGKAFGKLAQQRTERNQFSR